MRIMLTVLLLAATLSAGCSNDSTAPKPPPAEATISITEPWKSMALPIDGAVVVSSTKVSLDLSYPTHTQETAGGIVGVFIEALEGKGYEKGVDSNTASAHRVKLEHPSEGTLSLSLDKRAERPTLSLTLRPTAE